MFHNIVMGGVYPSCPYPEVILRVVRRDPHSPKGLEAGIGDIMEKNIEELNTIFVQDMELIVDLWLEEGHNFTKPGHSGVWDWFISEEGQSKYMAALNK